MEQGNEAQSSSKDPSITASIVDLAVGLGVVTGLVMGGLATIGLVGSSVGG